MFSHQLAETQASQPATLEMLRQLQDMIFGQRLPFLMEFPMTYGYLAQSIYAQAMTLAFREGFILVAVVFLLAILPTLFLKVDRPVHA